MPSKEPRAGDSSSPRPRQVTVYHYDAEGRLAWCVCLPDGVTELPEGYQRKPPPVLADDEDPDEPFLVGG
jgi:hypothetical protein